MCIAINNNDNIVAHWLKIYIEKKIKFVLALFVLMFFAEAADGTQN